MSSKQRIQRYYQQCDELLGFGGLAWWLIDLDYNPERFVCNQIMCDAFNLDSRLDEHSVQRTCPIAGDYNQNIAIKNSDKAKRVLNDYQQLLNGQSLEYHNRFPYYDRESDQVLYFNSRAKALVRDTSGQARLLLGTIEQETVNETLYRYATIDALTGLKNRRVFDQQLNFLLKLATREQRCLSLILCDIDNFKSYNDCLGHYEGDECLKRVAQTLQHCSLTCHSDVVCRYGGEEFAFIVYGKEEREIAMLAEQIRDQVYQLNIRHPRHEKKRVTVSVGYTCLLPGQHYDSKDLIQSADKALYRAKSLGRNAIANGNTLFPFY
ncbi:MULTISPECIES: GGDEF domain-containing protein [unclassified Vibrio]|uniref:diguanylate cyclase n=1 Tax=Vibrio sp. HB236076 TaxID=3232307 RepID=A0AB39HJX7_9VIBR|nr:GGDEF domain-containing protein [Vibrio sp. HB161653]MDP5253292.1 GGDEF domain-containing protein [Vibrio sp. HB161653]